MIRRHSLIKDATAKPKRIYQENKAVDDFGEMAGRKRDAMKQARDHGHQMSPWHARKNDPNGRFDSHCSDCSLAMTVCIEPPPGILNASYGKALITDCAKVSR